MKNSEKSTQGATPNRSVERAIGVLKLFKEKQNGLTFTDIWQGAGLPKATAFRVVNTLQSLGFLDYNEWSRRYVLGPEILQLGMMALKANDLYSVAHPTMEKLQITTKQTIVLYARRRMYKTCIFKIESGDGVRYAPDVGCPLALWRGASGIVLLSEFLLEDLDEVLDKASSEFESGDHLDYLSIKQNVMFAKANGYFYSENDYGFGAVNLAAPIRSYGGRIIGTINIAGAEKSFAGGNKDIWTEQLISASKQISCKMGYDEA